MKRVRVEGGQKDEGKKLLVQASVDVFVEAVEAAIHAILCVRKIYPTEIFERRRLYGAPTYMSRHPELNTYISTVLLNAKPLFAENAVDRIVCAIMGTKGEPLEYYVFDIQCLGSNISGPASSARYVNNEKKYIEDREEDIIVDIETQLRGMLLRTMALEWQRTPLPDGCKFTLLVHARETTRNARLLQSDVWMLAGEHEMAQAQKPGPIIPLRSVNCAGIEFQVFVVCPNL
jgi:hypothetical protein